MTFKAVRYGTQNGNLWVASTGSLCGVAATRAAAIDDLKSRAPLLERAAQSVVAKHRDKGTDGMLIVGANACIRNSAPFALLQAYDVHLVFYPNSLPIWVVGIVAFSRTVEDAAPIYIQAADATIPKAIDRALGKLCATALAEGEPARVHPKLVVWHTHHVYRLPKLSMKDVLGLEAYPADAEYSFEDQTPVSPIGLREGGRQWTFENVPIARGEDVASETDEDAG